MSAGEYVGAVLTGAAVALYFLIPSPYQREAYWILCGLAIAVLGAIAGRISAGWPRAVARGASLAGATIAGVKLVQMLAHSPVPPW